MPILDSNVLIDVLSGDPRWGEWSKAAIRGAIERGERLVVNAVIYAEVSAGLDTQAQLDDFLSTLRIDLEHIPTTALFAAGRAFRAYRNRSGTDRNAIIADFIIGAHAIALSLPLVTRDVRRYRTYLPAAVLISP